MYEGVVAMPVARPVCWGAPMCVLFYGRIMNETGRMQQVACHAPLRIFTKNTMLAI
jgi:hypothetical protein